MNKLRLAFLTLVSLAAASTSATAQSLTFDNSLTFGSSFFTQDTQGVSWLTLNPDGSHYHADLDADLGLSASSGINGSGWVFNDGTNTVVISQTTPESMAADPFVSYGYAFINNSTGSSSTPFSMSFTSNFLPVTPDQTNLVRATFILGLTDASSSGPNDPGVSAQATQSGSLSDGITSTDAGVTLISGMLTATSGSSTVMHYDTLNAPNYIAGPGDKAYTSLTAMVSGTYSSGSILVVSGRIDAIPEPKSFALFAGSGLAVLIYRLRRLGSF